jgi:hypothetical protein
MSTTKTVYASVDTHANQDAPALGHGTGSRIVLKGQASHVKYGYVLFARPFPLGALILNATLTLRLAAAWGGSQTITVRRVTAPWRESTLNWNNKPATTATHEATVVVAAGAAEQDVTVDLTDMLADVSAGSAWYGVRVEVDGTANRYLWASEAVGKPAPKLDLEWTLTPDAVTDLHPVDGAIVGSTTPVVTWTFRDVDGTTDQASSQVQVDNSPGDFATPVYDSGMVANGEQQWQIPSGLSNGGDYWWRVKVTDTDGNVSDWSDVATFHVTTRGTLTLNSPTATPPETTPPVSWTLGSGTQVAYQIILRDLLAPKGPLVVWDTGRVASTDTSVAIPAGRLVKLDASAYELEVRVWDDTDRQSTPGSPAYSVVTRTLTLTPTGTPADISTLTATDDAPAVVLDWTRSSMPDYWLLRVDGEVPKGADQFGNPRDRLDPSDYLVAGTAYRLNWYRAEPDVEHVYEVVAVVIDGSSVAQLSSGGPTATFTSRPIGLWLVDEASGTRVRFEGRDDPAGQWQIGEEATDYYPVGRRKPVHVVTSLRGYEGQMQGLYLQDWGETTADDWRDAFEELKASGSSTIRMIVQGFNLPVDVWDLHVAPMHPHGYSAAFTFAQTDEFTFSIGGAT